MTKTRRQMEQDLKQVDAVCEIMDARIPISSRNPDIDSICGNKPRMVILNRLDLADPDATARWASYFKSRGIAAVATDCKSRKGINQFTPAVRQLLHEKIERDAAKGMTRALRIMIVGIPNVGKSTLINQISGRKGAKAENRPGVTRGKQWVTVDKDLLLMDTPGILWPKFEDPNVGMMLAYTGAVKDGVMDLEELACRLMGLLWQRYPDMVKERYGVDCEPDTPGWQLLEAAGKKRGYLLARGEINTERMAKVLIDEFRGGKLGRLTLELPEDIK
jgi:ribosome biogenesis GTPase A